MQERVLREALRGGAEPAALTVESRTHTVESLDTRYRASAVLAVVDRRTYLDYTEVPRTR